MDRRSDLTQAQKRLYDYLRGQEQCGKNCTIQEITAAAGLKLTTVRTYLSKGYLNTVLTEQPDGSLRVKGVLALTEAEFRQQITQTQALRELGHSFSSRMAKALLRKSRDNMILALELYNRPSLENRLDAFVTLFCCAWEQLLKAGIIECDTEDAVFRPLKKGQLRRTIGLKECLDRVFGSSDPVRSNIERIKFLRDEAAHLLMPELQGLLSRVFQAGVFNFEREFRELAGARFLPRQCVGLMTLIVEPTDVDVVAIRSTYGRRTASEILSLVETLRGEVNAIDDQRFSIPIEYKLVFTGRPGAADIRLTKGETAPMDAVVIEKPVDSKRSHPLNASQLADKVTRRLRDALSDRQLEAHLVARKNGAPVFNSYDLQAVLHTEKWKKSDNIYHYTHKLGRSEVHTYSLRAAEVIGRKVVEDPSYVAKARRNYKPHLAKRRFPKGLVTC